jgi:hypothetical protein
VDKNTEDEKQKGLGFKPSPNYYQSIVEKYYTFLWLLAVTKCKEELADKLDDVETI